MDVKLVMFKSDGERRNFPLKGSHAKIGRGEDCEFRIPLPAVSRHHCQLIVNGDGLTVKDLGSSNGTYVNNKRVTEAKLQAGDRLVVGPIIFTVQIDGQPEEISPAAAAPKAAKPKPAAKSAAKPAAKAAKPAVHSEDELMAALSWDDDDEDDELDMIDEDEEEAEEGQEKDVVDLEIDDVQKENSDKQATKTPVEDDDEQDEDDDPLAALEALTEKKKKKPGK